MSTCHNILLPSLHNYHAQLTMLSKMQTIYTTIHSAFSLLDQTKCSLKCNKHPRATDVVASNIKNASQPWLSIRPTRQKISSSQI